MKKFAINILLLLLKITTGVFVAFFFLITNPIFSANISSISDGSWSQLSIWSSGVVPSPTDEVTISHNIQLDMNVTISSPGSLTINLNSSLKGNKNINIGAGASLINFGTITCKRFSNSGTCVNFGTINTTKNFNNTGLLINTGMVYAGTNFNNNSGIVNGPEGTIISENNVINNAEEYLNQRYIFRYNTVSNKFEYKEKIDRYFKELNENNLYIKLQKDNINISINNLIALLKSDFINEFNPFIAYFESLPKWDGQTDYIQNLTSFLKTNNAKRLEKHFKKWLVRAVRTSIDNNYFNKQAFVLVSNKQNSGKSTFCRFLCPKQLSDYIVENIGTDKDSLIAITENFLINLDELSTADKNEINAFKSMFSKDKIKARLTYDKRASVHVRRANFIGSTDRWEFLTDENGSVRWLCFDIEYINWNYSKEVSIDKVYSQVYHLLKNTSFEYEITQEEIKENDYINKKYQVNTPERDLIQRFFIPGTKDKGKFMTATDILEYLSQQTIIKLTSEKIGKELRFLEFERTSKKFSGTSKYGYLVENIIKSKKNS